MKCSDQAHRNYVSKLAACRQFVELQFQKDYGIVAYPLFDILLAIQISGLNRVTVSSISKDLAIPSHVLQRYLTIAANHRLVTMKNNAGILNVVLEEKGTQKLSLITNAITKVAAQFEHTGHFSPQN